MIDTRLYDIHLDPAVWILLGAMALCFILIAAVTPQGGTARGS